MGGALFLLVFLAPAHEAFAAEPSGLQAPKLEPLEIYSGAVPIRLGADALGGGVNLISNLNVPGTHANASYGVGSFASHRITAGAQHLVEPAKLRLRVNAFADGTLNRYPVHGQATDDKGLHYPVEVPRAFMIVSPQRG